ncbi:MAG: hypothetical protein WCG93_04725 [Paludibacter sp.]
MQTKKNQIFLILLVFCTSIYSQKILFSEDFVAPLKWKISSNANGSMTFEKEGTESVMKVEAYEGKKFQVTIKIPAIEVSTKKITIQYDFYLNELYNSQVFFGESPNRLRVMAEKNKTQRLAGEAIQMADGAKFLSATSECWHKMLINYDMQSKLATFTLDGKDTKIVDLNLQPEKSYQFVPTLMVIKSIKGGSIKVKAIKILVL